MSSIFEGNVDKKNLIDPQNLESGEKYDLHLSDTYKLVVDEIKLQQSKRDTTVAFYMTVMTFAVSNVIKLESIDEIAKGLVMLLLYVIGFMLTYSVLRYRIYKEVYWITVRVISQLYTVKTSSQTKDVIQKIFYKTMQKNAKSVIDVLSDEKHVVKDAKKWTKRIGKIKTFKKMAKSAESIMFGIQVLISSGVLLVGIIILLQGIGVESRLSIIGGLCLALINIIFWDYRYIINLAGVYKCVLMDSSGFCENSKEKLEEMDKAFNATYEKAWFLHTFISIDD